MRYAPAAIPAIIGVNTPPTAIAAIASFARAGSSRAEITEAVTTNPVFTESGTSSSIASLMPDFLTCDANTVSHVVTPIIFVFKSRASVISAPRLRMIEATASFMFESCCGISRATFPIIPPNLFCIPSNNPVRATFADTAPFLVLSISSATDMPMWSAIIFHAGIPVSASWRISSADNLPFAAICPMASVTRSIPSFPSPTAMEAFPTAFKIGITD